MRRSGKVKREEVEKRNVGHRSMAKKDKKAKLYFLRTCPFSFPPPGFESTNRTSPTPARSTASRAASTAASEEAEEEFILSWSTR